MVLLKFEIVIKKKGTEPKDSYYTIIFPEPQVEEARKITKRRRRRRCAATWDASRRNTLEESVGIMARGATTMDAKKMFMLEESAKGIIS